MESEIKIIKVSHEVVNKVEILTGLDVPRPDIRKVIKRMLPYYSGVVISEDEYSEWNISEDPLKIKKYYSKKEREIFQNLENEIKTGKPSKKKKLKLEKMLVEIPKVKEKWPVKVEFEPNVYYTNEWHIGWFKKELDIYPEMKIPKSRDIQHLIKDYDILHIVSASGETKGQWSHTTPTTGQIEIMSQKIGSDTSQSLGKMKKEIEGVFYILTGERRDFNEILNLGK